MLDIIERLNNDEMCLDAVDEAIYEITSLRQEVKALENELNNGAMFHALNQILAEWDYPGQVVQYVKDLKKKIEELENAANH